MKVDPDELRVDLARTVSHLSSAHKIVERAANGDDHQQPRHHPPKDNEHPPPVTQPRNNDLRLRKADLLTQALDNIQRGTHRPERAGKMRLEGSYLSF